MALKASIYQAEGNLQEAAKSLVQVNAQTNSDVAVRIKLTQLRFERNPEAIRWYKPDKLDCTLLLGLRRAASRWG